ncbi:MAG: hypothetical protein K2K73_01395 [Ureaplasma sp.]|nr:hypothetical protein [Ureaplasma sp.]
MKCKIKYLENDEINSILKPNEIIIATFSREDWQESLRIIKENKIKRVQQYSLENGLNLLVEEDYYLFKITDLKTQEQKNIVRDFIEKYCHEDLYKVIKLIDIFATKISSEITFNKLQGDIGEALFIQKCINLGFKDEIYNSCNQLIDNEERIDFILNNQKFEIKTTTWEKQEINITDKQILEKPNVVVINATFNKNDKTILDIYDEIKKEFNNNLPEKLNQKYLFYAQEEHKCFINNLTLNKNDSIKFSFYDEHCLPIVDIKNYENVIKKITYTLNSSTNNISDIEFNKILINKINNN